MLFVIDLNLFFHEFDCFFNLDIVLIISKGMVDNDSQLLNEVIANDFDNDIIDNGKDCTNTSCGCREIENSCNDTHCAIHVIGTNFEKAFGI